MTRIESGTSLYDYTKLMILGELMEEENTIVKRKEVLKADRKSISEVEFIKITVCNELDVPIKLLLKRTRESKIREARQIAMYFCRELTTMSFSRIGKSFDLDHATVIHTCNVVNNQILFNHPFKEMIDKIRKCITES